MIAILKEKPKKVFDHVDTECIWLDGRDDFGVYGYSALKFVGDFGSFHLEIIRFGLGVYETMKSDWPDILAICKENNCKRLSVVSGDNVNEKQWSRLVQMFGFPEPVKRLMSEIKL